MYDSWLMDVTITFLSKAIAQHGLPERWPSIAVKVTKLYTKHDFNIIDALIMLDWCPDQIVGYCNLHGYPMVNHELIYKHIWTDKFNGGMP